MSNNFPVGIWHEPSALEFEHPTSIRNHSVVYTNIILTSCNSFMERLNTLSALLIYVKLSGNINRSTIMNELYNKMNVSIRNNMTLIYNNNDLRVEL